MPPAASIHCGTGYASWHSKREMRLFRIACADIASMGGYEGSQFLRLIERVAPRLAA
jgi:hypothetical protein